MYFDPRRPEPLGRILGQSGEPLPLWKKALAFLTFAAAFILALMVSAVLFAAVLAVGTVALGWLWWKTRAVRKQMRDHPPGGLVIEGEVIRERHEPDNNRD